MARIVTHSIDRDVIRTIIAFTIAKVSHVKSVCREVCDEWSSASGQLSIVRAARENAAECRLAACRFAHILL
jgi:hypothetical protein